MRLILPLLLLLAACGSPARVDMTDPIPTSRLQTVHVVHMRGTDPDQPVPGSARADRPGYGRFVVAIPPAHQPGQIARPRGNLPADPALHFTLAAHETFNRETFRRSLAAELAAQPRDQREVSIFVHGFNTAFIQGLYRVAQLGHDLQLPGVLTHFSWPSLGVPLAYAHDRDSALFARDGLQAMIADAQAAGASRVILIGHSMGAHLVMETLRQMAMDGSLGRARIGGVVLISPDIDVDVFRMQVRRIGALPQPFLVVTSRRDRILRLSARLTGEPDRLGNLAQPERVADLGVVMLDVSAFGAGDGHFTLAQSPALIRLLARIGAVDAALARDASGDLPLVPGTILTLQNTTETLLQAGIERGQRRPSRLRLLLRPADSAAR